MSTLSTHVLDLVSGQPAAGMEITLWSGERLFVGMTNIDGRCPDLSVAVGDMPGGSYRLEFAVAAYFRGRGMALSDPPFLDIVPIAFGMAQRAPGEKGGIIMYRSWSRLMGFQPIAEAENPKKPEGHSVFEKLGCRYLVRE